MGYDGTVKIGTELDSSGVKKGLDEINGTAQSGFSKFSEIGKNALSVFAGNMLTGVVSQAKNAAGAVLDIGMSFESGMSKVEAISGATGEDLAALTDKAKEMGAKTKFSATESAEAMQYMAMAGWKTSDMLNGIEGIMNLAAASGLLILSQTHLPRSACRHRILLILRIYWHRHPPTQTPTSA